MTVPVFRFAPSPNGHLHLGHAYSAILNHRAAKRTGGRFLLRIEDIDTVRCTPELEADMLEDLAWLGLEWEEPVLRQSDQFADYASALTRLEERGLTYRGYLTRAEIKRFVASRDVGGKTWPRDPDGAPHYPGDLAVLGEDEVGSRRKGNAPHAIRLDMKKALAAVGQPLSWHECAADVPTGKIPETWFHGASVAAQPDAWGDVVLARKDTPTSYHLSVVIDDARQGVTDVLRGKDLYEASAVHRLLQVLLDLPAPRYRHHELILDETGRKLSKSGKSTGLRDLRLHGCSVEEVYALVGLSPSTD
jgi:glutamyl-Q tRNA(Asp) synthetase